MNLKAFCDAHPVSPTFAHIAAAVPPAINLHTADLSPSQRHIDRHILEHCGCLAMGFRLPLVVRSVESGSTTCTINMTTILRVRGQPVHTYCHHRYVDEIVIWRHYTVLLRPDGRASENLIVVSRRIQHNCFLMYCREARLEFVGTEWMCDFVWQWPVHDPTETIDGTTDWNIQSTLTCTTNMISMSPSSCQSSHVFNDIH